MAAVLFLALATLAAIARAQPAPPPDYNWGCKHWPSDGNVSPTSLSPPTH